MGLSQALADDYGVGFYPSSSGLKPDNSVHTFCFQPSFTGDNPRDGAIYSMDNLQGPTTMTKDRVPDCDEQTDAKFNTTDLGFGVKGRWTCVYPGNYPYCRASRLDFDRSNINSLDDWKGSACHELGHSVGLAHGEGLPTDDCMSSYDHNDFSERIYNSHHVKHINDDRF